MNFTFVALLLFSLTANVRGSFSTDTKNDELVYHANYQDLAQENLSMLRFEPVDEFAKTEQQELDYAAQSFWGRLYVDRFPGRVGFQYFRAHFGLAPPMENVIFRLASPSNLCEKDERLALYNKTGLGQDIILVAWRGDCSFTDKALAAHESGADGVLYVNNVVSCTINAIMVQCQPNLILYHEKPHPVEHILPLISHEGWKLTPFGTGLPRK